MTNDVPASDGEDGVTNVYEGDAEEITQVGHVGEGRGGVTNVMRGSAGNVIQAGDISGDINLTPERRGGDRRGWWRIRRRGRRAGR